MKLILILGSLISFALAEPPVQSFYGVPRNSAPSSGYGAPAAQQVKQVYVQAVPDEIQRPSKIIQTPGQEEHINIIFVKAPASSSQQQTEVILPEQPQQKTLVYVLVQKQESENQVRVHRPRPTQPSKPEVFFIRYKNNEQSGGGGGGGGYGQPTQSPSSSGGY